MSLFGFMISTFLLGSFAEPIKYNEATPWTDCKLTYSPIDIPFYNTKGNIVYQPYPSHYINRTYYSPINQKKFELVEDSGSGIFQILPNFSPGKVYVTINKVYLSYSLQDIRFHIYSEHTLEGMKTELEMQLIHMHIADDITPTPSPDIKYLGISVLFSAIWDEDNDFLSVLAKPLDMYSSVPTERYEAASITSMDLNQFFIEKNPYYYYTGSGTTPEECKETFHWFVMKKVEKMSWKQLEQIQSIMYSSYPNGNSRKAKDRTAEANFKIEYVESQFMLSLSLLGLLLLFFIF